ncbi:hypothetical protein HPP92_019691 [Vanilla planifolia]|uniref:40S ribosomal protein S27 n=1 Tax=Vanilla planifolia TaxID=51239 RepID=A0A835QA45_VANPL|nr:hypothetical protein HPP92_019691 [Vanilla planifolia]
MVLQNDIDLLNPPAELEKRKHKLKRLVQSPNSFFMDVKCQGCFNIQLEAKQGLLKDARLGGKVIDMLTLDICSPQLYSE